MKMIPLSLVLAWTISLSAIAGEISPFEKIHSMLPNTNILEVKETPIPDLYYAFDASGHVFHVDVKRNLIIFGEIFTPQGKSLTAGVANDWQKKLLEKQIGAITQADIKNVLSASISSPKLGKRYEFIEFTDPDCPFCKSAADFLANKEIERHIVFFPLPMHPDAKQKAIKFVSAKNPFAAYKSFDLSAIPSKGSADKVENMMAIASKHGINSTPIFWVLDTKKNSIAAVISGANVGEMEEWIRKNSNGEIE